MDEIPLKLYEILGFSFSYHILKKNLICVLENYYSERSIRKIIFNSLCLEYFQQIDDKSDLKIINKFNFGIEFYSNGISTYIKNIIKSYNDCNSIIFKGTDDEVYHQKIAFLRGCYLRKGENFNIIFSFFVDQLANFILKLINDVSLNIFQYKIIDSNKEGGGCLIRMNNGGELLLKLFNS